MGEGGKGLASVQVPRDQLNVPEVAFTLKPAAASVFAQFTTAHNEQVLGGQGVITLGNNATLDDANVLAIQLRSGSLPISLRVAETQTVRPTLGQDSVHKSIIAGIIEMLVILAYLICVRKRDLPQNG